MGLLDFLKKDEYKSSNQSQTQPVNLGQQPPTQSPLLPGSAPAPIPKSNPAPMQPSDDNQNTMNPASNQSQIQPYDSNPTQNFSNNDVSNFADQNTDGFQPMPEAPAPTDQAYSQNTADGFQSNNQTGFNTNNNTEETIFGEGDLADLYTEKFPDPQNIQPTVPGQSAATPNINTGAEPVVSMADQDTNTVDTNYTEPSLSTGQMNDVQQSTTDDIQMEQNPTTEPQIQDMSQADPMVVDSTNNANNVDPKPNTEFSVPKFDMDAIMASTQKAMDSVKPKPMESNKTGQIDSADEVPQAQSIEPEKVAEVKPVVQQPVEEVVEENKQEKLKPKSTKNQRRVFSKIGVLGLDGPNINSLDSEGIFQTAKSLLENKTELIFGTDKGLVPKVLSNLNNPKFKISTVSLQPILAVNGTDKVNAQSQVNNFAVVYSNFVEWLRHIMKEARLFIVFDGAGVENHTMLLNLISISKSYGENGKPIILIGESWKAKVDGLKKIGVVADADLISISILNNTDELQAKLDELNAKYANNKEPQYARVVDRRVEGDEKEFVVY